MKYTKPERLEIGRQVYNNELTKYEAAEQQKNSEVVNRWNEYMSDILVMEMDPKTGAQPLLEKVFSFE